MGKRPFHGTQSLRRGLAHVEAHHPGSRASLSGDASRVCFAMRIGEAEGTARLPVHRAELTAFYLQGFFDSCDAMVQSPSLLSGEGRRLIVYYPIIRCRDGTAGRHDGVRDAGRRCPV